MVPIIFPNTKRSLYSHKQCRYFSVSLLSGKLIQMAYIQLLKEIHSFSQHHNHIGSNTSLKVQLYRESNIIISQLT